MNDESKPKPRIAVIGTGLAGLVAAHELAHIADVHIYEQDHRIGIDAGSVEHENATIDMPMRSFAGGFYPQLTALCSRLHVPLRKSYYGYTFSTQQGLYLRYHGGGGRYGFWCASFPDMFVYAVSYIYFCILALVFTFVLPVFDISLGSFLRISGMPRRFTALICELFSVMCGLTHSEVLQLPAIDVLSYKAKTTLRSHYSFRWGIQSLKRKLLSKSIHIHLSTTALSIRKTSILLQTSRGYVHEDFDHVILAVPPTAARSLLKYTTFATPLSHIPTRQVQVITHTDNSIIPSPPAHINILSMGGFSLSTHRVASGTFQTTSSSWMPGIASKKIVSSESYVRTLRTVKSRQMTRRMCEMNGKDRIWLVGGWVWDGLVLLEGCVVSAQSVAEQIRAVYE